MPTQFILCNYPMISRLCQGKPCRFYAYQSCVQELYIHKWYFYTVFKWDILAFKSTCTLLKSLCEENWQFLILSIKKETRAHIQGNSQFEDHARTKRKNQCNLSKKKNIIERRSNQTVSPGKIVLQWLAPFF